MTKMAVFVAHQSVCLTALTKVLTDVVTVKLILYFQYCSRYTCVNKWQEEGLMRRWDQQPKAMRSKLNICTWAIRAISASLSETFDGHVTSTLIKPAASAGS